MKRKNYISGLVMILAISLFGCSKGTNEIGSEPYLNGGNGVPRLVIKGTIKNMNARMKHKNNQCHCHSHYI